MGWEVSPVLATVSAACDRRCTGAVAAAAVARPRTAASPMPATATTASAIASRESVPSTSANERPNWTAPSCVAAV